MSDVQKVYAYMQQWASDNVGRFVLWEIVVYAGATCRLWQNGEEVFP